MKRKVRTGRIVAVAAILVICALAIAAGSGWANNYKGNGYSYSYNQGSQHHNTYYGYGCGDGCSYSYNQGSQHHNTYCGGGCCGGCGGGCGCQTGVYIYYNGSGCGKCGGKCCPDIDPPERPDCDDFCGNGSDTCSYNQSSTALGGGFAFDVPQLGTTSLGLEKPAIPTVP